MNSKILAAVFCMMAFTVAQSVVLGRHGHGMRGN